ncbi:MAG: hypothetical protein AAF696_25995 [Bacteroidota bacterium]
MMHKQKNFFLGFLCLAALTLSMPSDLQAQTHEIGIRLSSLENFDFIYKKERAPDRFARYRLGIAGINYVNNEAADNLSLQFGFAYGVERRRAINDELSFIHGFEPFINLLYNSGTVVSNLNVNAGLGYVLGFQYDFSEEFYVNMETIPSIGIGVSATENNSNIVRANAGFNSNAVSVTLAYRFKGKRQK